MIESREDVKEFNESSDFWFHATVVYRIPERKVKLLKGILKSMKKEYFSAHVLRIISLRRNRIAFEYDVPSKRLLKRSEALSKKVYRQTLKKYKQLHHLEVQNKYSPKKKNI